MGEGMGREKEGSELEGGGTGFITIGDRRPWASSLICTFTESPINKYLGSPVPH